MSTNGLIARPLSPEAHGPARFDIGGAGEAGEGGDGVQLLIQFLPSSVTIILVSYYNTPQLRYCLPALCETIPPQAKIILIDNATSDTGLDWVVESFPRIELVRSPHNGGFGFANNIAARLTDSEYLVFLNPDTVPLSGWLERLIAALQEQPLVGLVTPKILLLTEPGINTCGNTIHITGISMCRGVRAHASEFAVGDNVTAISGACFAMRRSLFLELGGFDETFFMYMEDTDISLRARLLGYEIAYVADSVIKHDYLLKFNESKIFLQERNRYLALLKALKWQTLAILLPALVMAEVVVWGFVLFRERAGILQKIKAYWWIAGHWKEAMQKRRATQKQRRVEDRRLLPALVWHLDVRQLGDTLLARRAERVFDAFFGPYAWCLHRLIRW